MIKKTLSKLTLSIALVLSMIGCGPEMPMNMGDGGHPDASTRVISLSAQEEFYIPKELIQQDTPDQCPVPFEYVVDFVIQESIVGSTHRGPACRVVADTRDGNVTLIGAIAPCNSNPQALTFKVKLGEICPQLIPTSDTVKAEIIHIYGNNIPVVLIP
jgi:hypothetical protein